LARPDGRSLTLRRASSQSLLDPTYKTRR